MLSWERLMTWLGIKVLESGGRVEKDRNQGVWSAVFSSCSLWWFGCHVAFWSWLVQSQCNCLLGDFQVDTSCFHLVINFIKIQVSFFSRTQHLPGLLPNHHITVLDWLTDSPDLNPAKKHVKYCQGEDEKHLSQKHRWAERYYLSHLSFRKTSVVR